MASYEVMPASMATTAKASRAGKGCRLPRARRGSGRPSRSSLKEASASMLEPLCDVHQEGSATANDLKQNRGLELGQKETALLAGITGSQAGIRELPQGEGHGHLVSRAAGDGLGELHVADARAEIGVGHRPFAADRRHEISLDLPSTPQRIGDRQEPQDLD